MNSNLQGRAELEAELARLRQRVAELEQERQASQQAETALRIHRDLALQLESAATLDQAAQHIYATFSRIWPLDRLGVYLIDDAGNMNLHAHWNLTQDFVASVAHYPAGCPQLKLMTCPQPLFGPPESFGANPAARQQGIAFLAVMPLLHFDNVVGSLIASSPQEDSPPPETLDLLRAVSSGLGGMLVRIKAEQDLAASEERFRLHFENASDVICSVDMQLRITSISPSVFEIIGYHPEELIGRPFPETGIIVADDLLRARQNSAEVMAGRTINTEFRTRHKDGREVIGQFNASPLVRNGQIAGMVVVIRDVTEHRRAEQERRSQLHLLQTLLDAIPQPIFYKGLDRRYLGCNDAFCRGLGLKREQVIGRVAEDLVPAELADVYRCMDEELFNSGGVQTYEFEKPGPNGPANVIFHKAIFHDEHGRPGGLVGTVTDITQRKRMEDDLRRSETKNRALLAALPDRIIRLSREGVYLEALTPADDAVWLHTDWIGQNIDQVLPPDRAAQLRRAMDAALATRQVQTFEYQVTLPNGSVRFREARVVAAEDEAMAVIRDITDRKRAEDDLRRSEARNRALIDAVPDVMYSVSRDGVYGEMISDRGFEPIFPWKEHYQGRRLHDMTPQQFANRIMAVIEKTCQTGQPQTLEYEVFDPHVNQVRHREARYSVSGPDEVLCLTRDISQRVRMEKELISSNASNRALLQAIPDSKFRVSRDGVYLEFIPGTERPALEPEEFLGKSIEQTLPPEVAERYMKLSRLALETGQTQVMEYRMSVPLPDGPVHDYEARIAPCGNDEAFVLIRNISDRKQMERDLRDRLAENRALIRAMPDQLLYISPQGVYLDIIQPGQFSTFRDPQESVGKSVRDLWVPKQAKTIEALLATAFDTGAMQTFEYAAGPPGAEHTRLARIVRVDSGRALMLVQDITDRKRAERAIQDSEARLKALIGALPDRMILLDGHGRYLESVSTSRFPPLLPDASFLGKTLHEVLPAGIADKVSAALESALATRAVQMLELELTTHDGRQVHRENRLVAMPGDEVLMIIRDITDRKQAERQLRTLASQLSLTEERERRRIASELHDRIGQALALAKIQLGGVRRLALPPAAKGSLDKILALVEQTINDTRSLTFELSPPILYELGLEPAIDWLAEQIGRQYGVRIDVEDDNRRSTLGDDVRIVLFLSARELLINAAKHAQAQRIIVKLTHADGQFSVEVADDGIGFDPAAVEPGQVGFGLFSIQERLAALGGRLEIDAQSGRGSRLTISGPAN